MEATTKKQLKIAISIVCFGLAVGILYFSYAGSRGSGIEQFTGKTVWMKCSNPDCGAEYETDKKGYFKYMQEHQTGLIVPAMSCKECKQESSYRAIKCSKCGLVFYEGSAQVNGPHDQCPKCGYSATRQ